MANTLRISKSLCNLRSILIRPTRLISTTPKKQETITADTAPKTADDFRDVSKQKNWVSWGFDTKDQKYDTNTMHATAFFSITLCLVIAGYLWGYAPDALGRDWAQREAFLILRKREAAGLEPISRDYVDAANIVLPSDEELGKMDIII